MTRTIGGALPMVVLGEQIAGTDAIARSAQTSGVANAAEIAAHEVDEDAHGPLLEGVLTNANTYADTAADTARDEAVASISGLLSSDYPNNDRAINSGTGLTGGGDLSADRTLAADFGTGAGKVTQGNDSRLSDTRTPTDASVTAAKVAATLKPSGSAATTDEALRALGTAAGTAAAGNDSRITGAVQTTRTLTAGYGMSGLGDLSADRTPAVGLSTVVATLGSDLALTASTTNDVLSSGSLAIGTWLVTANLTHLNGNNANVNWDMKLVAGTATVTFSGATVVTGRGITVSVAPSNGSLTCIATVTAAGTVKIQVVQGAGTATAKATGYQSGTGVATAITAVRLA